MNIKTNPMPKELGSRQALFERRRLVSGPIAPVRPDHFIRFSGKEPSKPAITREQEKCIRKFFGWYTFRIWGSPRGNLNELIKRTCDGSPSQWLPIHRAVASGRFDVVQALIAAGSPLDKPDWRGNLPIHLAAKEGHLDIVLALIAVGSPLNQPNDVGLRPVTLAEKKGYLDVANALTEAYKLHLLGSSPYDIDAKLGDMEIADALTEANNFSPHVEKLRKMEPDTVLIKAGSPLSSVFLASNPDVVQAITSLLIKLDPFEEAPSSTILLQQTLTKPEAWVELLPFLFEGPIPSKALELAIRYIEAQMDANSDKQQHDNAAELMASLKSPAVGEDIHNRLSSALSSVFHWINKNLKVTGQHLNIWGDLGLLSHGFKIWKYDAQGKENSLFAKYGCESVQVNETNRRFGNGFYFEKRFNPNSNLDAQTKIMLLRGVLLVSQPSYGTLAIRNSSLAFGRDLLQQPAYYIYHPNGDAPDTAQALVKLPREIENWISVLDPHLESLKRFGNVEYLTNQLLQFKQDYQQWKFNTTQFDDNQQFTGHQNGGLKAIAEWLKLKQAQNESDDSKKTLPALAFVHPQYPPYASYAFTNASGEQVDKLPMTPKRIEELQDFVQGSWSSQKYPNSSLQNFLQEGIQQHAELILVDADAE